MKRLCKLISDYMGVWVLRKGGSADEGGGMPAPEDGGSGAVTPVTPVTPE